MVLARGKQIYYGKPADAEAYLSYHELRNPNQFPVAEHLLEVAGDHELLETLQQSIA